MHGVHRIKPSQEKAGQWHDSGERDYPAAQITQAHVKDMTWINSKPAVKSI
jgi:hypothetical protein